MRKQILISFLTAAGLFILLSWWMSTPYSLLLESSLLKLVSTATNQFGKTSSEPMASVLFVNTAHSGQLVTSDDGLGNEWITDREKLASFLKFLNSHPRRDRIVICDLRFEKESPEDSILAAVISATPNIYFPFFRGDTGNVLYQAIRRKRTGSVDYKVTNQWWRLSDKLMKLPLMPNDSSKALPLVVYEDYTGITARRKGGLLWLGQSLSFNNIFVDEKIRNYSLTDSGGRTSVYPLEYILSAAALSTPPTADLTGKKWVVIGDFEKDVHNTSFGQTAGPVILFNTLIGLINGNSHVRITWILFMLVCFTAIIQFTFYGVMHRIYENILAHFDYFLGEGAQILACIISFCLVAILSYTIFNTTIEVMAASAMMAIILKVKENTPKMYFMLRLEYMAGRGLTPGKPSVSFFSHPLFRRGLKLIVAFLILLLVSFIVNAQPPSAASRDITVLNVAGGRAWLSPDTTNLIKPGTRLTKTDRIHFSSSKVVIPVIVRGEGVYCIRPQQDPRTMGSKPGELYALIKDAMGPMEKKNSMAGRGGTFNSLDDLQNYFSGYNTDGTALLVINSMTLTLSSSAFPDREKKYFFMRYTYKGQDINKRLAFDGKAAAGTIGLVLDTSLLRVDGRPIRKNETSDWHLYYYDSGKETAWPVAGFSINVLSLEGLSSELCRLKKAEDRRPWLTLAKDYLNTCYGITDDSRLDEKLSTIKCP